MRRNSASNVSSVFILILKYIGLIVQYAMQVKEGIPFSQLRDDFEILKNPNLQILQSLSM